MIDLKNKKIIIPILIVIIFIFTIFTMMNININLGIGKISIDNINFNVPSGFSIDKASIGKEDTIILQNNAEDEIEISVVNKNIDNYLEEYQFLKKEIEHMKKTGDSPEETVEIYASNKDESEKGLLLSELSSSTMTVKDKEGNPMNNTDIYNYSVNNKKGYMIDIYGHKQFVYSNNNDMIIIKYNGELKTFKHLLKEIIQ